MARSRKERQKRKRAGSSRRDSQHRTGGDWTTLTIPEGVELFQPKAGSYRLDIVPYEAGSGNPYADVGDLYYERTYFTHRAIGPNSESYVCPAKTAGKKCPVCEDRARMQRDPDSDTELVKSLRPKERQLWLVFDHGEKEKGVQLWEFSHWNFGKLLDTIRQNADEDEEYKADFDDPEGGASLKVLFSEESGGGYSFIEATSIEFKPRKDGLDEELLEHGVCLDSLLKIPDYDKLKAAYLQVEDDEEGEELKEGKPRQGRPPKKKPVEEEEDQDSDVDEAEDQPTAVDKGLKKGDKVEHEEFGDCTIARISGDGTSLTITEDDDGTVHKGIGVDEVEKVKVKPKKKVKPKPPPADDEDDDEPWDEEEDDEPDPPPKKKKAASKPAKEEKPPKQKPKNETFVDDDDDDDKWDEGWDEEEDD